MRILHILTQTELTGSEVYAQIVAREMQRRGHHSSFVSDDFHVEMPGPCSKEPVSSARGFRKLALILELRRQVSAGQIDLIHCHSRGAARIGFWAGLGLVPVVSTLHGEQHYSRSKRLFDTYGMTIMVVADAIRQQLISKFKTRPEKIKIVRNPLAWPLDLQRLAVVGRRETCRLFIAGRDSGPKGERLRQFLKHEVPALLKRLPWLEISILEAGSIRADFERELHKADFLSGRSPSPVAGLATGAHRAFSGEESISSAETGGKFKSRIRWVSSKKGLEKLYRESDVVVGGGRIALEAASLGCEVVVFGEKQSLGWLNAGLWGRAVRSNFGDMGDSESFSPQFIGLEVEKASQYFLGGGAGLDGLGTRGLRAEHFSEYQLSLVGDELEQIYRSCRMGYNYSYLPILMYHKVLDKPEDSPHRIFVTTSRFESHLKFFKMMGFKTLTFSELADFWYERKPLQEMPWSPLLLTFDDGYRSNLVNAGPLLVRYKMKASLFLLADSSIRRNTWDPAVAGDEDSMALLDPSERARIEEFGFRVESHGLDHARLTELPDGEVLFQLEESRRRLSAEFGHEISCCAYPFGAVDARLPVLAAQAGYSFAVNTDRGGLRWFDEPCSLFRVNIFPEDGWFDLWRKTLPWYRRRYFRKRGQ